jgi:hypothetical protein
MSDKKDGMAFYLRVGRWVKYARENGISTDVVVLHPSDRPYYWLVVAAGVFAGIQFKELGGDYLYASA